MNCMTQPHSGTAAFRAARDLLLRHREDYAAAAPSSAGRELERVQLGARLVRRDRRRATRAGGAVDRRRRRRRAPGQLRRAVRPLQPGWPTGCAALGVARGDRVAADARQRGRALGDHAGRDEAGRGRSSRPPRCSPPTTWPTASTAATSGTWSPTPARRAEVRPAWPAHCTRDRASRGRPRGLARATPTPRAPTAFTPDGPTQATDPLLLYFTSGTTAQPKLVAAHPRRATRSGTCRRCTGSACSPATCT